MAPNPSRLSSYRQSVARRLFYTHLWVGLILTFGVAAYFYLAAEQALEDSFHDRFVESGRAFALTLPSSDDLNPIETELPLGVRLDRERQRSATLQSALVLRRSPGQVAPALLASSGNSAEVGRWPAGASNERGVVADTRILNGGQASSALIGLGGDRWLYLVGSLDGKDDYLKELRQQALLAFIAAVLLAALMAVLLSRDTRRVLQRFAERCQQIAEGRFRADGDSTPTLTEFGDLADALEGMAERLARVDAERTQALEEARSASAQLERNVRERTAELDRLNSVLRKEIEQRCQLEAVLAEAAATDALTRLLNRRGMVELLEQLAARTHQQRRHFCVAIADVDHFKSINDRFGHASGDRVLVAVASRLRRDLKGEEAAARWGGEEFLMVWPEIPLAAAEERANRLREALAAMPLFDGAPTVTISFGLVEYSGLEPLDACLVRADKALYRAKELGRDRVVVS
ncbi:MAG: diguanylate cyclase [Xanthomonadales bacterium]|nr:diguanylate cyclase [Xanthomonadales bacterium]